MILYKIQYQNISNKYRVNNKMRLFILDIIENCYKTIHNSDNKDEFDSKINSSDLSSISSSSPPLLSSISYLSESKDIVDQWL